MPSAFVCRKLVTIDEYQFIIFLQVRRFVSLEQSMVGLERVQEFTELVREPPEFIEPRPSASWPEMGQSIARTSSFVTL